MLVAEVALLKKKQDIKLKINWVPPDSPEHAERLRKCMAEFLARSLRPDFYRAIDEADELFREADAVIAETREFLASIGGQGEKQDDAQKRIAELEAEIARLKGEIGKCD